MTKIYSHSRLSTFEQCPLKYKLRYIDKIIPEIEKTIEIHLGSVVHDTLEWIYNAVIQDNKSPNIDEIITYYSIKWQDEFSEEILIVKKELDAKDYFQKGVEFLLNYYQKYYPFKDGTIECEKKIEVELDENIKIQGFIDRLVHNIETGEYEIHDYKTANTLPTQEKMDQDRQLALYSIAIKELYGQDKEVSLIWHYLAHNQKICSRRTNEQLEQLKQETKDLIKEIESSLEFPHKKSILCGWCEYKEICPAWNPNSPHQTTLDNYGKKDVTKFNPFMKMESEENNNNNTPDELDIWD
jgi:putative RecB family exonuclease